MNTSHESFVTITAYVAERLAEWERDPKSARGKVTSRTVSNWLASGRLPEAFKDDQGTWRIPIDAVELPPRPRTAGTLVVLPTEANPAPVALPAPSPAPVPLGRSFAPKRRPFPIADVAAEFGVPVETVRRWAKDGEGGLSLSSGAHGKHYVWIEAAG